MVYALWVYGLCPMGLLFMPDGCIVVCPMGVWFMLYVFRPYGLLTSCCIPYGCMPYGFMVMPYGFMLYGFMPYGLLTASLRSSSTPNLPPKPLLWSVCEAWSSVCPLSSQPRADSSTRSVSTPNLPPKPCENNEKAKLEAA